MPDSDLPLFSIGAVSRMLELPAATIRTWETRYGLVVPRRSEGGQRLFSRNQVDQLRFVREEIERGGRPGQAHRLLAERLGGGEPPAAQGAAALAVSGPVAGELLREVFERNGLPAEEPALAVVGVSDADRATLSRHLEQAGGRVLRIPVCHLLDAARSLAEP